MGLKLLDRVKYLAKALLLAFIVTLICIIFFSSIISFTSIKESNTPMLNTITFLASISIGSIYFSLKNKEKGWINGGIFGISYSLILLLINIVFLKSNIINLHSLKKLILGLVIGIIGGIIGINMI